MNNPTFGGTWWGKRWIEALERLSTAWQNRLPRGRDYATKGHVISLQVSRGKIVARVQGSRSKPYHTTIETPPIREQDWDRALRELGREARFPASLLAGEMPLGIDDAFQRLGLPLFPIRNSELLGSCTCPDKARPCKHIAAVHFAFGEALDRDPFLLFQLRGADREELIRGFHRAWYGNAAQQNGTTDGGKGGTRERGMPVMPLSADRFNRSQDLFDTPMSFRVQAAETPALLLSRLGAPVSWTLPIQVIDLLGPVYEEAARLAVEIALSWEAHRDDDEDDDDRDEDGEEILEDDDGDEDDDEDEEDDGDDDDDEDDDDEDEDLEPRSHRTVEPEPEPEPAHAAPVVIEPRGAPARASRPAEPATPTVFEPYGQRRPPVAPEPVIENRGVDIRPAVVRRSADADARSAAMLLPHGLPLRSTTSPSPDAPTDAGGDTGKGPSAVVIRRGAGAPLHLKRSAKKGDNTAEPQDSGPRTVVRNLDAIPVASLPARLSEPAGGGPMVVRRGVGGPNPALLAMATAAPPTPPPGPSKKGGAKPDDRGPGRRTTPDDRDREPRRGEDPRAARPAAHKAATAATNPPAAPAPASDAPAPQPPKKASITRSELAARFERAAREAREAGDVPTSVRSALRAWSESPSEARYLLLLAVADAAEQTAEIVPEVARAVRDRVIDDPAALDAARTLMLVTAGQLDPVLGCLAAAHPRAWRSPDAAGPTFVPWALVATLADRQPPVDSTLARLWTQLWSRGEGWFDDLSEPPAPVGAWLDWSLQDHPLDEPDRRALLDDVCRVLLQVAARPAIADDPAACAVFCRCAVACAETLHLRGETTDTGNFLARVEAALEERNPEAAAALNDAIVAAPLLANDHARTADPA